MKKNADRLVKLMTDAGITPANIAQQPTYQKFSNGAERYSYCLSPVKLCESFADTVDSLQHINGVWYMFNNWGSKSVAITHDGTKWVAGPVTDC